MLVYQLPRSAIFLDQAADGAAGGQIIDILRADWHAGEAVLVLHTWV